MSQLTETFFVIIHFAVAALSTRVRRSIDGARAPIPDRALTNNSFVAEGKIGDRPCRKGLVLTSCGEHIGFSGVRRQIGGIEVLRLLPFSLIAAGLLIATQALAQQPEEAVRQVRVGDQTRFYKLEKHHTENTHSPLPIIIYLHGTGARITEPLPARYDIPFADLPDLEPALIVHPQGANRTWDAIHVNSTAGNDSQV